MNGDRARTRKTQTGAARPRRTTRTKSRMADAVSEYVKVLGKHASTGYLTPPVTVVAVDVLCTKAARLGTPSM